MSHELLVWSCPVDRAPLERSGDELRCTACAESYRLVDGVAVLTGDRSSPDPGERALEPLLRALVDRSVEEAAAEFCDRHGCRRKLADSDWKFLFGLPSHGRALEIGAGFGDETTGLAGQGGQTCVVQPGLTSARIVRRHLDARGAGNWPVCVLSGLGRLPLVDHSVDAVVIEDMAGAGFSLSRTDLPVAAGEWRRVLRPGGTVFLGLANRLHRLPVIRQLREAFDRPAPQPMNRAVREAAAGGARRRVGLGRLMRVMARQEFGPPKIYAPFPNETRAQVVLPVNDPPVVRYFLDNLLRKNSRKVRLFVGAARILVALGLFHRLLPPYYYLVFRDLPDSEHRP